MKTHSLRHPFQVGLATFAAGLLILPAAVQAQEAQIQVLGVSDVSGDFGESLAEGAAMSFTMEGPGTTLSFGSPIGGVDPNNRSQLFGLLSNESVRQELKLSEEQYAGVKQIMKESQRRMSELIQAKMKARREQGGSIQLNGSDFRELMEANREEAEAAIEEILLPSQLERVSQLAYQIDIHQEGIGESLVNGRLGEEIGVHDDQKQNLTDRAAKIEAEAQAAIIAIRAKAREKLFKELTPDQRKAAEKLLGDYFHYEELSISQQLRRSMNQVREERESKEKPRN